MSQVKISLSCTCGAAWNGTVSKEGANQILLYWKKIHAGDEHSQCDAKIARKARAKSERKQEDI